jgi:hypothetical protein
MRPMWQPCCGTGDGPYCQRRVRHPPAWTLPRRCNGRAVNRCIACRLPAFPPRRCGMPSVFLPPPPLTGGSCSAAASAELVPGDLVEVGVGGKVPADARVMELLSSTLRIDQVGWWVGGWLCMQVWVGGWMVWMRVCASVGVRGGRAHACWVGWQGCRGMGCGCGC